MTRLNHRRTIQAWLATVAVSSAAFVYVGAQTRISAPKNSYSVRQDVELGREAAKEVHQQMPILNDATTRDFVERIGSTLVDEIPQEFRHPEFHYTFEVVNLKEINAFALPGGPMFVNRGMLEAAKTDGEVAGVMAHELSHGAPPWDGAGHKAESRRRHRRTGARRHRRRPHRAGDANDRRSVSDLLPELTAASMSGCRHPRRVRWRAPATTR